MSGLKIVLSNSIASEVGNTVENVLGSANTIAYSGQGRIDFTEEDFRDTDILIIAANSRVFESSIAASGYWFRCTADQMCNIENWYTSLGNSYDGIYVAYRHGNSVYAVPIIRADGYTSVIADLNKSVVLNNTNLLKLHGQPMKPSDKAEEYPDPRSNNVDHTFSYTVSSINTQAITRPDGIIINKVTPMLAASLLI